MARSAHITRDTKETKIDLTLELDGAGRAEVDTGVGFFDHMLTAFATHAGFDLRCKVAGDLAVDAHHTVEDTGIVLGRARAQALGDKSGIARYGSFFVPMDEALGFCALDISGRPFLVFEAAFHKYEAGGVDYALVEEFFRALAMNAGVTLHLRAHYGSNDHHIAEALFKACAHALAAAVAPREGLLSTKGVL